MDTIAQRLSQAVDDFLISLFTVDVDWEAKPSANQWSAKQILGHLLDSANINLHRFVRCTYEQNFKLVYAQNQWVAAQHYEHAKTDDLLTLFRLLNRQISRVLESYPEDAWQNTCDTGRDEPKMQTIAFLADDYVAHLNHHLKQITG
ncbi:DinB family protein [Mucilaginibacter gracilis]|uniref:DinB family protein n=1 Tax=Mucilaginibacter gracilis TaxID=423350 RepID=A0A495J360_9SPHI|nr:DinB family protein [Mucilaginibacter gracilis]RKR82449.1 DinB family protein [Mucilaginibacter gracilis]